MCKRVSVLALTVSLVALSASGVAYSPGKEIPPRSFETYDELDTWARSATRHGGVVQAVGPWNENLYCVVRYHDREGLSAEFALYRFEDWRGYQLMLYLPPEHRAGRDISVEGDVLAVSQWKPASPDTSTLRVPLAMLPGHGRPSGSGGSFMDPVGDLIGYPDELGVAVNRGDAMDIARGALSDGGYFVRVLRLRESQQWGVVWRAEGLLSEPLPGMDSSGRTLLIDAGSGEIVHDIHWGSASAKPPGASGGF